MSSIGRDLMSSCVSSSSVEGVLVGVQFVPSLRLVQEDLLVSKISIVFRGFQRPFFKMLSLFNLQYDS